MIQKVREHVRVLLNEGKIGAFVGLQDLEGNIIPYVYEKGEDLDNGFTIGDLRASGDSRYPLARVLLTALQGYPDTVFGVLVRGCDERALNELTRWNQIVSAERIVKVGIACPSELAQFHECRKPFPDEWVAGEKTEPVTNATVAEVLSMDLLSRLSYWKAEFDRCIKCYGCRNVCPVCFCNVCTLEEDSLIRTGDLPPENPMFHLTRAIHMAGRCIDCNLCTEACPADIPLRTLYKRVAEIVKDEFGYLTGESGGSKSPLNILGPDPGHTAANE
jgi:formate dehydrogenase (coenzyme F420) beta subunit